MKTVEAVVFDLEGTLLSCPELSKAHLEAILDLIAQRKAIPRVEARILLSNTRHALSEKLGYQPAMVTTVTALGITRRRFYRSIESIDPSLFIKPDSTLIDTMFKYKQKCRIGLLTNVSFRTAVGILEALGLDHNMFDSIVAGDDVSQVKPAAEPFLKIAHLLLTPLHEMTMVGDRVQIDLVPAKKLGVTTALLSKHGTENPFVDHVVKDISTLYKLLFHDGR